MQRQARPRERFVDKVRIFVSETESLTTVWVRLEKWPRMTRRFTWIMQSWPMAYQPNIANLSVGMLTAVPVKMDNNCFYERAQLLRRIETRFVVLLIDWGLIQHHQFNSIRILPAKFVNVAPWVRKINLRGVQPPNQSKEALNDELVKLIMRLQRGTLLDVHHSPIEGTTARLPLDCSPGQSSIDIGSYWLNLGYVIPKALPS